MANFTRWPSIRLTMADRERLERLANVGRIAIRILRIISPTRSNGHELSNF